jgi:UPF0060 membrane protein ajs_1473
MAALASGTFLGAVRLVADLAPDGRRANLCRVWGMYIAVALVWLHFVDGVALTRWDLAGASIALAGMAIIALQPATGA